MTDMQYGGTSTGFREQGVDYFNNTPVFGLSSHMNWLEDFSPNRVGDVFRWIPVGLYNDLIDDRDENVPLLDRVNLYTNQQLFNALDNDVFSLDQFRIRLLIENNNLQANEVNQIFALYDL